MVDYNNVGPSLQFFGARFLNFLLSKLSRDFKLRGMSILQDFQRATFIGDDLIAWNSGLSVR